MVYQKDNSRVEKLVADLVGTKVVRLVPWLDSSMAGYLVGHLVRSEIEMAAPTA